MKRDATRRQCNAMQRRRLPGRFKGSEARLGALTVEWVD
jgi:hypothetical protein